MIVKVAEAIRISKKIKEQGRKIVLVGGCFDIIHLGHIKFLESSRKLGILFVLLENDKSVKKLKGKNRPINIQIERAYVLAALRMVNYVVLLSEMKNDKDYDKLITLLSPSFIATTENDLGILHKKRQARLINGQVKITTKEIKNKSTTKLAKFVYRKNN